MIAASAFENQHKTKTETDVSILWSLFKIKYYKQTSTWLCLVWSTIENSFFPFSVGNEGRTLADLAFFLQFG